MTMYVGTEGIPPGRIILLPDIQNMTERAPDMLEVLFTRVISRRPDLVMFTGDLVERNVDAEWGVFAAQLGRLTAADIRWVVTTGNHDTDSDRLTLVNNYVSAPAWATVKDAGHVENSYCEVRLAGRDWIVLSLEYSPRTTTVAWANAVAAAHGTTPIILSTHAYLYSDGTRYDWASKGESQLWNPHSPGFAYTPDQGISDGQELWDSLVRDNSNIKMVLCGHVMSSEARRTDVRLDDSLCHQIVQDYQTSYPHGAGYFREYYFDEANRKIYCTTFSVFQNRFRVNSNSNFYLDMP